MAMHLENLIDEIFKHSRFQGNFFALVLLAFKIPSSLIKKLEKKIIMKIWRF
jgi:hypothetical protein